MVRFRNFSITTKLASINLLVSAVALLVACAAFASYDIITFRQTLTENLSAQARIIGSNCISALVFNDRHSAEATLGALKEVPHVLAAEVYTSDGRPFAGYRRDGAAQVIPLSKIRMTRNEAHWFVNKQLTEVYPIVFQNQLTGFVYIQRDLREINTRLERYAGIAALVLAVSLFAALLVSSILRRVVAERIIRVAETARIIRREQDFSVRATASDNNRDELASLIAAFNEMLEEIQKRDAALLTAQDELEMRVEERTAQLVAVNKELEAFSYSVSHDLRAPLRHVDGFSMILMDQYGQHLDATAQHYLKSIREGAKNMGQLVDDLLNFGRLGRQQLVLKPTDLNTLVKSVVRDLQPECENRQIEWRIGTLPGTECDPSLMKQVFVNLIANAVKYTRRREQAVIQIGQQLVENEPAIFVRDNGAGFDQRYVHKLFGVFQRLHRAEEFEGTGVGLAIVRRIVEKHGGRIWAEGEIDKGAAFFFTLGPSRQSSGNAETRQVKEVVYESQ